MRGMAQSPRKCQGTARKHGLLAGNLAECTHGASVGPIGFQDKEDAGCKRLGIAEPQPGRKAAARVEAT